MRKFAGIAATLVLVGASDGIAEFSNGAPELVAVVHTGVLAVDSDCRFYRHLLGPERYEFLAQGPVGRPASLVEDGVNTNHYFLGMANGDVYDSHYTEGSGLSFNFVANIFGSPVNTAPRTWSAVKQNFSGSSHR